MGATATKPKTETGISAKLVEITPKLAEQLLARNTHNRAVTMARVDQYAADMKRGDWQVNGEAIKVSVDGQILDGQHRLIAILEADTSITTLLIKGLPAESQETMDQGRARGFADVLKLRGEHDYNNLAAAVRIVCLYERDGVPFQLGRGRWAPSVKQLSRTLERNPEIRDSCKVAQSLRRGWVLQSAVGALHYLFSIASLEDANDFFTKLATGEDLSAGDPIYTLRERLIKEHYEVNGGVGPRPKIAFIVRAWNAYRQGETLTRLVWNPGGSSPDRFPEIDGLAVRELEGGGVSMIAVGDVVADEVDQAYLERELLRALKKVPLTVSQAAGAVDAPVRQVERALLRLVAVGELSEMDDGRFCG